jgi:hypothetical protein
MRRSNQRIRLAANDFAKSPVGFGLIVVDDFGHCPFVRIGGNRLVHLFPVYFLCQVNIQHDLYLHSHAIKLSRWSKEFARIRAEITNFTLDDYPGFCKEIDPLLKLGGVYIFVQHLQGFVTCH